MEHVKPILNKIFTHLGGHMQDKQEDTICRKLWHLYISGEITEPELQEQLKQFEKQQGLQFKAELL